MADTNGNGVHDITTDAVNDLERGLSRSANDLRVRAAEQLRELSSRFQQEADNNQLDERLGIQVEGITSRVDDLADYLATTDVETISDDVKQSIQRNPWLAVSIAFLLGTWIGRRFGRFG